MWQRSILPTYSAYRSHVALQIHESMCGPKGETRLRHLLKTPTSNPKKSRTSCALERAARASPPLRGTHLRDRKHRPSKGRPFKRHSALHTARVSCCANNHSIEIGARRGPGSLLWWQTNILKSDRVVCAQAAWSASMFSKTVSRPRLTPCRDRILVQV